MDGVKSRSARRLLAFPFAACLLVGAAGHGVLAGEVSRARGDTVRIVAALDGTGVVPAAAGDVLFQSRGDTRRLAVHVAGIPAGACDLLVGGQLRGSISVRASGVGEIEFLSAPADDDEPAPEERGGDMLPLGFDPRGRTIEVVQGGAVILTVSFPSRPQAGDNR